MSIAALDNLVKVGQLKREPGNQEEFDGLVRSGRARLADAANPNLAFESRFDLAYNGAHALALAALRWPGYRSSHRYTVFQALVHTLGLDPSVGRVLSKAHEMRNQFEYAGDLSVDDRLLEEVHTLSVQLAARLAALGPLPTPR